MRVRDQSIDVAKGILTIFVVYGHVFSESYGKSFVYAFHIPAFFIISGMLICVTEEWKRSWLQIIQRNIQTIVVPYIFFEIVGGITYYIRFGYGQNPVGLLYNSLVMRCNNGPDWFLYILFISRLILVFAVKLHKQILKREGYFVAYFIVSMAATIAAVIFSRSSWLIAIVRKAVIAHGFLTVGFTAQKLLRERHVFLGLCSLVAVAFLSALNPLPDMSRLLFGNPALYFVSSILGSYAVLQVSKCISSKMLSYLGCGSIIVMGTHNPFLYFAKHVFKVNEFSFLLGSVMVLVIILLEFPVIYIIQNYLPWVIGKKKANKR